MQRNTVEKLKGGEKGNEMSNELFHKMVCVFKIPVKQTVDSSDVKCLIEPSPG